MEPAHQEQPHRKPMCNDQYIFGVIYFFEIAVQGVQKIAHAVVLICALFAVWDSIIKCAEAIPLFANFLVFVGMS